MGWRRLDHRRPDEEVTWARGKRVVFASEVS